jgi:sec-independent protein translocase protein TatA
LRRHWGFGALARGARLAVAIAADQGATMGLGFGELILILAIVLLVFGARRLPQLGDAIGKTLKSFKAAHSTRDDAGAP